jgi:Rrf2 family protein
MLKLSKKVDYALILLGRLHAGGSCPGAMGFSATERLTRGAGSAVAGRLTRGASGAAAARLTRGANSAREMAERHNLPLPMVANILKSLTAARLLTSTRGAQGGYTLARDAGCISLAELVEALDGPIGLMDCTSAETRCDMEHGCPMHSPIQRVQKKFHEFMTSYTLADIFAEAEPRPLRRFGALLPSAPAAPPEIRSAP